MAEDGAVALRECAFVNGDWLSVATYNVVTSERLALQEIGILENSRKPTIHTLRESLSSSIQAAHIAGYGRSNRQRRVRSFLAEQFTKVVVPGFEHEYKSSVALASLLLSRKECDGIAFPAMKSQLQDINLAIKPESAAAKLVLTEVNVVSANRVGDQVAVTLVARSERIGPAGEIIYRHTVPAETASLPWVQKGVSSANP